jgi:hypothetical protein
MRGVITWRRALKGFVMAAILIGSATGISAQSGKRGVKKSPVPSATPGETKPPETRTDTTPKLELLVGIQDPGAFDGVPAYVSRDVIRACVARLNESAGVAATVTSDNLTRHDAIKLAKGESQGFVVWLEVRGDSMDASTGLSNRYNIYLAYTIFQPGTAKVKASGRAQYGTQSAGPVGVGLPRTSNVDPNYAIRESARQAADKILAAFEISADGRPR